MLYKKVWRRIFNEPQIGDPVLIIGPWVYKGMKGRIVEKVFWNNVFNYLVKFKKKDYEKLNIFRDHRYPHYCGGYFEKEDLKLL